MGPNFNASARLLKRLSSHFYRKSIVRRRVRVLAHQGGCPQWIRSGNPEKPMSQPVDQTRKDNDLRYKSDDERTGVDARRGQFGDNRGTPNFMGCSGPEVSVPPRTPERKTIFAPVAPAEKLHPDFERLRSWPGFEPARWMF